MDIFKNWGFKSDPFETLPLPANRKGVKLMVGREKATRKIQKGLYSSTKYVTVEGLNGVGKTSVINVSVFEAAANQITSGSGALFIPCRKVFQIDPLKSTADFRFEIFSEIAQTLISSKDTLPIPSGYSKAPTNPALNRWLNSIEHRSIGLTTPVFGGSLSISGSQTEGFNRSGFERSVRDWLELLFPTPAEGGVVCVIDNLELLQTSKAAREQIESLRDDVLSIAGVRWVLCGALGIIEGVASSPRMAGYLQGVIPIDDLKEEDAAEIYRRRIEFFKSEQGATVPLSEDNFVLLFKILRGNLRAVLKECGDYCTYASDIEDEGGAIKNETFDQWFNKQINDAHEASVEFLGKRALEVFEIACRKEAFSPSDHSDFGYDTPQAMRPQIKALETAGLLVSTQDDADKRRRTVQVVAKGWKVKEFLRRNGIAKQSAAP
jgi:DNA-binding MarR family transcriptional regulator